MDSLKDFQVTVIFLLADILFVAFKANFRIREDKIMLSLDFRWQ